MALSSLNLSQPCVSVSRCADYPFCAEYTPAPAIAAACSGDWTAGAVWRGGEVLAHFLLANAALVEGARVLELGGGTGLVGLAAVIAGAAEATITDQHPDQAAENVRSNPTLSPRVRVLELSWSTPAAAAMRAETDIVIGADLVYPNNVASITSLLAALQGLRRPTILAYVERSEVVSTRLEHGLLSLSHPCCRKLRVAPKTVVYALDRWAGCEDTGSRCSDVGELNGLVT
eukprot:4416522-Prymnesium_polylepis.1